MSEKGPIELKQNGRTLAALPGWHPTFVGKDRVITLGSYGYTGISVFDAHTTKKLRDIPTPVCSREAIPSPDGRYFITLHHNQTMCIWSPEHDKPLLTFYKRGMDWVIWTPEGYYAASPGGERMLGWKVDNGMDKMPSHYAAERFRTLLYRPGIIKRVLEKGSVAEAVKAANAAEDRSDAPVARVVEVLPPRVTLTLGKQAGAALKLKVRAEAALKTQPITSLRLMMDGKPVVGDATLAEFSSGKLNAEVVWEVDLPEGTHQLAVLARSPDAWAVSAPQPAKFVATKKRPVLHVLTVGIDQYKDKTLNLQYAAADARALAKAFAKHCKGEPFRDVNAAPELLDKQATVPQILAALEKMSKQVDQHDLMIVFFACHGVRHKNDYYLLTHETNRASLAATALHSDKLRHQLAGFKCKVLLMLDACHAGQIGNLTPGADDLSRDAAEAQYGITVMCAAMGHEKARGQNGHGYFTRAVLETLERKPGVPYNLFDQRIYVNHIQSYVLDSVRHHSEEQQHPYLILPLTVEPFVVR